MQPRERVQAALSFDAPDVVPLRIYPAPGGLFEHGERLRELTIACGHDFGDLSGLALPEPPAPEDYDSDGRYHAFRTDDWGTRWEYRIFGIWGHPVVWPLDDWSALDTWRPPAPPRPVGPGFEAARDRTQQAAATWFTLGGSGSILEKLSSLRRFENVLMEIALDTPEINQAADLLVEYNAALVEYALALGVDGVAFGDDFGTQEALLCSPDAWRRFFRPRYAALFEPIRRAGKRILFHSCGQISELLEDLADLGVDAIWPQLPAYDSARLARICHDLHLAVELHPDRGELMQHGTPAQVRDYVLRLVDTFGTADGGSWLYLEVDPGFPWANVEALFNVARELRR